MLKELINYDPMQGAFFLLKDTKPYRQIFPDDEGYLIFYKKGKKYKIKANKLAVELGNNLRVPKEKVVLHKNLDTSDYRLQNLSLITRKAFNSVKEAQRNLSSYLKLVPHNQDVFSYVLNWREEGKDRVLVVQDIVIARRMFNKLQLKYAKILSKYCVFD